MEQKTKYGNDDALAQIESSTKTSVGIMSFLIVISPSGFGSMVVVTSPIKVKRNADSAITL